MDRFSVRERLVEKECSSDWSLRRTGRTCSTTWYVQRVQSDIFTSLKSNLQSGEELPDSERPSVDAVAQDGSLAIIAGSDTTSSTLTAVIYYLLLNPVAYERLQEEVDSAFLSGEEPLDVLTLSQMEYLNGCMWVTTPRSSH